MKPETIHDSSDDTIVATPLASINPDPEIEALFDGPTQEEVPKSTVKTLDLMKTPKTGQPILVDDEMNESMNSQTSECLFDKSEADSCGVYTEPEHVPSASPVYNSQEREVTKPNFDNVAESTRLNKEETIDTKGVGECVQSTRISEDDFDLK